MEQKAPKEIINAIIIAIMVVIFLVIGALIVSSFLNTATTNCTPADSASTTQNLLFNSSAILSPIGEGITSSSGLSANDSWMEFDGVNDRIDLTNQFCEGGIDNFSVSAWVKVNNFSSAPRFISRLCGEGSDRTPFIGMNSSGSFIFRIRNVGDVSKSADSLSKELNTWYNIVGVYNSTDVIIYVNSVLENFNSQSGAIKNSTGGIPKFGFSDDSGAKYLDGSLDEIRIYNRSLSQAEVTEIYNSGRLSNRGLPENELLAYYPFNEGSGQILHDVIGGNNGV